MNFIYSYTKSPDFGKKIGKQILIRMIPHKFICLLFPREAKINIRVVGLNFAYSYAGSPDFRQGKQILARIIPCGFVCLLFLSEAKIYTSVCSF